MPRNRDREKDLAYAKNYQQTHKAQVAAYNKRYRAEHADYFKAKGKEHRAKNRTERLEAMKEYHAKHYHKRYTGVDRQRYTEMCAQQESLCKICQRHKKLCVDHCHTSGDVRGLLCRSCNTALGLLADNVNLFHRAIAYLERRLA